MGLQRCEARRFIRVLESGRTSPLLIECECYVGDEVFRRNFIVKAPDLPEVNDFGLYCELLGSLLAKEFGVETPEPALVELSKDFVDTVNPILRKWQLVLRPGLGFGSAAMEPGAVAASGREHMTPEDLIQPLRIFCFDLLIQNPDRRPKNPNCAFKDGKFIAFDFNLAFSFLMLVGKQDEPWEFSKHQIANSHLFYAALRGKVLDYKPFLSSIAKLSLEKIDEICALIPFGSGSWDKRVLDHFESIKENASKLDLELQRSLL